MTTGVRLSPTSKRVLAEVKSFWADHGYAPSSRDLQMVPGCASTSSVFYHLHRLRAAGYLTFDKRIARSIVVKAEKP